MSKSEDGNLNHIQPRNVSYVLGTVSKYQRRQSLFTMPFMK